MKFKHYFIASEENDYRPWVISPTALVVFCLVIWSLRLLVPGQITQAANGIDPTDLMNRINDERTQRFIPALTTNSKLVTAANAKAGDMISRSFFAHVDPDGNYVWPRIEATGYQPYSTLGENLAMDFTSASAVIEGWMNSPTHRQNIVNEKFEDQGLAAKSGTYEAGHDTIMVVSLFGSLYHSNKAATPPPPPVTQKTPPPPPAPKPSPQPTPPPAPVIVKANPTPPPVTPPSPLPPPVPAVEIYKDIKVSFAADSGHSLVKVDVIINGQPTLVTAELKQQSISLLPTKVTGQYLGTFTFDVGENLTNQTLNVEARGKTGAKVNENFTINPPHQTIPESTLIPVSNDAHVVRILRVVFGVFAALYVLFLVVDAIIIHRAKITRIGIHSGTHIILFTLIASISLFANWI